MTKHLTMQRKRNARRAATVSETAEIVGVTPREVQLVLKGDRKNETVLSVFMEIEERHDEILKEMVNWTTIFNRSPKRN